MIDSNAARRQQHTHLRVVQSDNYVEEVFGESGYLADKFDGYKVRDGQVELTRAVAKALESKSHLFAEGPTGCHVAGQGIMLSNGSIKLVENIRVGDLLMGPDGNPRLVEALAFGEQEIVEIQPVKGEPWRVNLDHVLTLVRTGKLPKGSDGVVDVTVRDWVSWSKTQKHLHKLFRAPVEMFNVEHHELQIGPYALGMILGDGSIAHASVSVCKGDVEIREECERLAKQFELRVRITTDDNGTPTYHLARKIANGGRSPNYLIRALRDLELMGKGAGDKFVPQKYLVASLDDRKQLLAGLIDTDGHLENGCFDFVSKSKRLAQDVVFLSRSIGLAAYMKPTEKSWQNGIGWYWRVSVSGHCAIVPCRIARKQADERQQKKDVLRTGFDVVPTDKVEQYFGFSLSGDGRYLLDDFTVTHNTGKSLAYCVPAVYEVTHAPPSDDPRVVIIATANIALQEQLVEKDLPLLQEILPWKFSFGLLKGINNYLCVEEMFNSEARRGRLVTNTNDTFGKLRSWADETELGDKSELDFDPGAEWMKFSTTTDECKGDNCAHADVCFARKAKAKAKGSQIIVTNYHMLFAHFRLQQTTDGAVGIFPPGAQTIIMDEVHKAGDIARDFFGFELRKGALVRLSRKIKTQELAEDVEVELNKFFEALASLRDSRAYKTRLRSKDCIASAGLIEVLTAAGSWFTKAAAAYGDPVAMSDQAKKKQQLHRDAERCLSIIDNITQVMQLHDDPNIVYHIETDSRGNAALKAKVVNVAPVLAEFLFGQHNVVCTSATLAGGGGKFDFAIKELGAPKDETATLLAESPFDFKKQALLVVPNTMPFPSEDAYRLQVAKHCLAAIKQAKGRTLCLFTSYKNLNITAEHLEGKTKFEILKQGDMPRMKLLARFKENKSSVLLGTESFWAGVDVPGEALSCVVVDRIPFPTPEDPVLDAISEHDSNWFFNYSIPRAQIQLKQGVGRLIRAVTDRGVVVMLDRRLTDKNYGREFIRALPPFLKSRDMKTIGEFLNG